ncbi:MAG: tetratricopeptide repeat protein [Bacteroidia bacterium]|nr:tetratricopeptide repeat protein [Bacteroidia bacterium]MCZ2278508.1 tetratricopeptide repeat protein [Bacteroidia bacterium]
MRCLISTVFLLTSLMLHADNGELKKMAYNLYISGQYAEAAPLYAQLISSDTLDPANHYFYGVCLLHSGGNRVEIIRHLETAATDIKTPVLVFFFLGKAFQLNEDFAAGITYYEEFKLKSNELYVSELKVDEQIEMCYRAARLYQRGVKTETVKRDETSLTRIASMYNESHSVSRLIEVPGQILKGRKKEMFSSYVYIDENKKWMCYSGPGKKSGKELFIASRKNSSSWNDAKAAIYERPFPFAVENPVISENGQVVYFSCNSFNSIGGYDLYQTRLNLSTGQWTCPEQLPIPVNSPADDVFLFPEQKEKKALIVSNRNSGTNRYGIFEIPFPFEVDEHLPVVDNVLKKEIKSTEVTEEVSIPVPQPKYHAEVTDAQQPVTSAPLPPDQTLATSITLNGFFYDAAHAIQSDNLVQLKVKAGMNEYSSPVDSSGAFSIVVPYCNHVDVSFSDGKTSLLPITLSVTQKNDSCLVILLSRKSPNGYVVKATDSVEMSQNSYAVQLGAFRERTCEQILSYYLSRGVTDATILSKNNDIHVVISGCGLSLLDALRVRKKFLSEGFNDAFIVIRKGDEVLSPGWDTALAD